MGLTAMVRGVGAGWRQQLAADLLARRELVDFVEVIAETCFTQSAARREALALTASWPVIPHGVKLSLGSAAGVDDERVRKLAELARSLRAPCVTEHVALTSAGGREIGHLTQLPRTREAVAAVARNVARTRRRLPDVPLVLENVAWTVRWPDDAMREEDFYAEIARATGCPLLLDLGNLHANALNEGRDPDAVLRGFPLDRVAMVHIAGGHAEHDFYYDDHASPVPEGVFALLETLVRLRGPLPTLLERDANFPPIAELARELERARATLATAKRVFDAPSPVTGVAVDAPAEDLAARQTALATALTQREAPDDGALGGFARADVTRTREVLQRKRVDDAMPLLPRLAVRDDVAAVARVAVEAHERPPRGAALSDAWHIAAEAARHVSMAADARVDMLVLRARFRLPVPAGEAPARRVAPFLGSAAARAGRKVWAVKGLGADAAVTLVERNGR